MIELTSNEKDFQGYLAEPKGGAKGGVIVIHEVWGLNGHTKDIAERFASEGYVALAPDLLAETDIAKYGDQLQKDLFNPEKRNEAQPKLRKLMAPMNEPGFAERTMAKLQACFDYLYDNPETSQKVAVNGYCFGGSYSFSLAAAEPRLAAAVPFYGHPPENTDELANINCPILAFYGEQDHGLVDDLPKLAQAMKAANVNFTYKVYEGCGHAFFNDTNPYAYNQTAAKDAWQRTLAFLDAHVAQA
jgi:carboxymethylenebutenolidase